ncbi:MAG: gamma-glutamyl-gamma-aminobutyrate hydrolase family protein [Clostridia bacterium]|nr:gamma-glutamyl-gamma-aminobutyrate hydrolase family protein [Clostridia bacterium]
MIVIGITPAQTENGNITINQDYVNAVARAGAAPVLLPLIEDEKAQIALLARINGLLLSGGPDVDPVLYGEEKISQCGEISAQRDKVEISLFLKALKIGIPVLGICRGLQVMNVALGGALYQDIETQMEGAIKHPCYDTPRDKVHEVTVIENSFIHRITGLKRFSVNSRHHQGIKRLGHGLVATAYSMDGLIEAVDYPQERFVTAIEWHPESLSDRFPEARAIFNAFAEACGK